MVLVTAGSGDSEESLSLLRCQQVAEEFKQTAARAVRLHQQVKIPDVKELLLLLLLRLDEMCLELWFLSFLPSAQRVDRLTRRGSSDDVHPNGGF